MTATREATILRLDDGRELAFAEFGDPNGTPVFAATSFSSVSCSRQNAMPARMRSGVKIGRAHV